MLGVSDETPGEPWDYIAELLFRTEHSNEYVLPSYDERCVSKWLEWLIVRRIKEMAGA
jgi:hypothetical protein